MKSEKKLKMEESNSTYCQNSFLNYTTLHQVVNHSEFVGCLQETILHWIPPAVLILFGVFEFSRYFSSKNVNRNIPYNRLNVSKLVFTGILILIHLCQIVFFYTGIIQPLHTTSDTTFIEQELIFTTSYIFSIVLLLVSIKYGIRTSPSQFLFYLVSVICGAAYFQSVVDSSSVILGLFCAHFVILIILLTLNFFADEEPKIWNKTLKNLENPTPQLSCSFASKLCYFWATPLMWKGYKNPLEPSSLWSVDPSLTSKGSVPLFDQYYEATARDKSKNHYVKVSTIAEEINEGNEENEEKNEKPPSVIIENTTKKSSIAGPLIKAFGAEFLFGSLLHLIHTIMMMMPSQIMKMLISHVQDHGELGQNDLTSNWKGYFFAGLMFAITVFQSLIAGQYYEILFRVGMKTRTVLISTIYRKSLRLANEAKKDSTTGEIVNLMSIDVQRFMVCVFLY